MLLRNQNRRKAISAVAAMTAAIAATAAICAPASFGSSRLRAAFWESDPIIFAVPTTVTPDSTVNCGVAFADNPTPSDPAALKHANNNSAASDTKHVTVYSNPPGVISYSGTVTGSSAMIPVTVSPTAAPGPVTVYIQTEGSEPISATTTVVGS